MITFIATDMWEYGIVPISFRDYNEYVTTLNELGKEGWIIGEVLGAYRNSPISGTDTNDHLCRRLMINASPSDNKENKLFIETLKQSIRELGGEKYQLERNGLMKASLEFIGILETKLDII